MSDNLPDSGDNKAITGIVGVQTPDDVVFENEISISPLTHDSQGSALDSEVGILLEDAAQQAERPSGESVGNDAVLEVKMDPVLSGEETSNVPPVTSTQGAGVNSADTFSNTLNAVTAFVAGLAVVGVVYAFAVQGSFDQYKSVVLGDKTESSN